MRQPARLWRQRLGLLAGLLLAAQGCDKGGTPSAPVIPPVDPISFGAGPEVTPLGLFVDQSTTLTFRVQPELLDDWTLTELRLYTVTAGGDSLEYLGGLYDDGDLIHGDEIEADGVYTGRLYDVIHHTPQTLRLRVLASAEGVNGGRATLWSELLQIPVATQPDATDLDAILALLDQAESDYTGLVEAGTADHVAKAQLASWLSAQPEVSSASISADSTTLWATYPGGLGAGLYLPRFDDGPVLGGGGRQPANASPESGVAAVPRPLAPRADDPDLAGANQALVLSPVHAWLVDQGGDPADEVTDVFAAADCPAFSPDTRYGAAADLEAFANLDAYGAVCILTHGSQLPSQRYCLLTGEVVTLDAFIANYWDLRGGTPGLGLLKADGVWRFAASVDWIATRNTSFPNSLVYVAACHGLAGGFGQMLLDAGAGAVCGFDDTVGLDYAVDVTRAFWRGVVEEGLTAGDAHAAVAPQVDPGHAHAQFTLDGNPQLYFGPGLSNGDFDSGQLAGWTVEGDGRVIARLGDAAAVGRYMAIISTGLGFTVDEGSIAQTLCLPEAVDSLRFDWNLFSEEFLEWCDSVNQDEFNLWLTDANGIPHRLFHRRIADLCDAVTPAGIAFDQYPSEDDAGVYSTGWRMSAVNVAPYAGSTVTIRFEVLDVRDSTYDTAVLLDVITLSEPD